MRFNFKKLSDITLAIGVLSLVACGGGGGAPGAAAPSVIGGTASKGLLLDAKVTAYCGVQSSTNIGTATTSHTDGSYSLTLTQACTLPVEVVVTPVVGITTMLDEVAGTISTFPSNFSMRAFVPSSSGSTITQQITPLTDMAAALVETAAAASSTALSAAVVSNANSAIISTVLGGNAALFSAVPLPPSAYSATTTTVAQQQLITLLSSISAAAQSQTGATPAEKIQATLAQMAAQANSSIPTVTATAYTVATNANPAAASDAAGATPLATINAGLSAITAGTATIQGGAAINTAIKSNVAVFQTAVVDSAASQTSSAATSAAPVTPPTAAGSALNASIASAKLLFANIRANLLSLVNPDTATPGFLQTQTTAMAADFDVTSVSSAYHLADIIKATQRATSLLVQTNSALVANPTAPVAPTGSVGGSDAFGAFFVVKLTDSGNDNWTCKAYYTATGSVTDGNGVVRQSPIVNNGGNPVATCNHFIYGDNVSNMQFQVRSPGAPSTVASGATFVYINRIRLWSDPLCIDSTNASCIFTDTKSVTGSLTATWDSVSLRGLSVLPNTSGGNVLPYLGSTPASLGLTYTIASASGTDTVNFTSTLTDGALSYGFKTGSNIAVTSTTANSVTTTAVSMKMIGQIQTAGFQYNGTITGSGTANTNGGGGLTTAGFTGNISTVSGSTVTPFLEGTFTASLPAGPNGTSVGNSAGFTGKVTNGSSVTSVSATFTIAAAGQQNAALTFNFPGYSITANGTNFDDVTKTSTMAVTSSDGTKASASRANGSSTVTVTDAGGTTIGTVGNGNQLNFTDHSYIVLN